MSSVEDQARSEAIDWVISLRDPAVADWDAFTAWLEASPLNNQAYERAALADDTIAARLAATGFSNTEAVCSNDNEDVQRPSRRRLLGWSASAAAAVVAIAVGVPMLGQGPQPYVVETAAGQHRSLTLPDGTRIDLNGDSRLSLDKNETRVAALDRGEATFSVVHDAANPFVVKIDEHRVQDVGTIFNVARTPEAIEVGVAEGEIMFNPAREAVSIKKGQMLRLDGRKKTAVVAPTDASSVASWRIGRLVYADAPLSRVAADLRRTTGLKVAVAPPISGHLFSGVIVLDGDDEALMARVGALVDAHVERTGGAWRLVPRRLSAH
jgi:transmembrane sensor